MKDEVMRCIYTRRSVRDFKDMPVPKNAIHEIINAGIMAPSAMNTQPWHFSIVEGKEKILYFGRRALKQFNLLNLGVKLGLKLKGAESIFYNAPLLIFISGKKDYRWLKDDVNLCVQNMFLAAHAMGIGSCWIGLAKPLNQDSIARQQLGISSDAVIVAPLIFGYPARTLSKVPKRRPQIIKWIRPKHPEP